MANFMSEVEGVTFIRDKEDKWIWKDEDIETRSNQNERLKNTYRGGKRSLYN